MTLGQHPAAGCRNLTTRCTAAILEHNRSSESRAEATQWFVQVFKSSEYASPLEGQDA
jgi:hypothetical protein